MLIAFIAYRNLIYSAISFPNEPIGDILPLFTLPPSPMTARRKGNHDNSIETTQQLHCVTQETIKRIIYDNTDPSRIDLLILSAVILSLRPTNDVALPVLPALAVRPTRCK